MLIWERWIWKTSLLNVAREFAVWDTDYKWHKYNFISIYIIIKDNTNLIDFIKDIKNKIVKEVWKLNAKRDVFKKILKEAQKMEGFWLKYKKEELSDVEIIDEFNSFLIEVVKGLSEHETVKDWILFIVDEADKANDNLNIGTFFKTLIESLHTESVRNVMVILWGLPHLKEVLFKSHESSVRLFREKTLSFLSKEDVIELVQKWIDKGNDFWDTNITITDEALNNIYLFSEWNPHYVQLICSHIYDFNQDDKIDWSDVKWGMLWINWAIEELWKIYYEKFYYKDVTSVNHRKVLDIMAKNWNEWVSRTKLKNKFWWEDSTLDSALASLKKKNIILKKNSSLWEYKLQRVSFAYWIINHKNIS
jgi:hypothetical protein